MTLLEEFQAKVVEYSTNNITAMMGTVTITSNEKEDLKLMFEKLDAADRQKAVEFLKGKKIEL